MIEKSGKLYINNKLMPNRYDKNENYGINLEAQKVEFYEIVKEIFVHEPKTISDKYKLAIKILNELKGFDNKITISKKVELTQQKDFMTLAFDPPTELTNGDTKK